MWLSPHIDYRGRIAFSCIILTTTYVHCVRDGEPQILRETFVWAPAVGVDVSSQLAEDLLSVCTILRPCILSIDRASTVTVPVHFPDLSLEAWLHFCYDETWIHKLSKT